MARLSIIDRLRIERAVWTVDTYLSGLPGRRRRAIRRELRTNLRASAAQAGVVAAIRDLGSLRRLSIDYLNAEYRGGPWPSMLRGIVWVVTVELVLLAVAFAQLAAYADGLVAGDAGPGTYAWSGSPLLGTAGEVTIDPTGQVSGLSFSLMLLPLLLIMAIAFIIGSRLWRLIALARQARPSEVS